MAVATKAELVSMDIASRGLPFPGGEYNATVNTETMDIPSRGLPFVVNKTAATGTPKSWGYMIA